MLALQAGLSPDATNGKHAYTHARARTHTNTKATVYYFFVCLFNYCIFSHLIQVSDCINAIQPEGSCTGDLAEFAKNLKIVELAGMPECGILQKNILYSQFYGELKCGAMQANGATQANDGLSNGGIVTILIFLITRLLNVYTSPY